MVSLQSAHNLQETLFTVAQPHWLFMMQTIIAKSLPIHDEKKPQKIYRLPRFKIGEMRIKFGCNALSVIMTLGLKLRLLTDADGKMIRGWSDGKQCDRGDMAIMAYGVRSGSDGSIRSKPGLPTAI